MTQAKPEVKNDTIYSRLIGKQVEFPVDRCEWGEGIVLKEDSEGRIVVQDEDGTRWNGWEYQVTIII